MWTTRRTPFSAAVLVRSLDKGSAAGEKFQAGRNDVFMSVYLPYCDQFVTAEEKGEQEKCLRQIVNLAGLEMQVLSYDDFCKSLLITV
jgi:hypothetical protein